MHVHFADNFSGIDFGASTRIAHRMLVDGGGGGVQPAKPNKPAGPSPVEQVKAAAKNGKVASSEKTVFEKGTNDSAVKSEETRLHKAVADKVQPFKTLVDDKGVAIRRGGKEQINANGYSGYQPTDHTQKLADLKKGEKLQDTDKKIADTKRDLESFPAGSAGHTTLQGEIDNLQTKRDTRATDEGKIAQIVKDKTSLIGTLAGEKTSLESSRPAAAKNDYQELREKAEPYLRIFREQGGQDYSPDLFGDDWDTNKNYDFDTMVKQFHGGDEVKDWDKHQDNDYQKAAVQQLQGIMSEYETARSSNEKTDSRISDINGETEQLNDSIKRDREVLSTPTLEKLDKDMAGDFDPQPKTEETKADDTKVDDTTPKGPANDPANNPNAAPKDEPVEGPANTDGRPDSTNTDTKTPPAAGTDETAKTRPVDYSTSEARTKVLSAAQKQGLVPDKNVSFDKGGNAVYNVVKGDNYWQIAQRSSGAGKAFDTDMFTKTMNTNSQQMQRNQDASLLLIGDQLTLQNRSVDDLVKLLALPTTEPVPVEVAPEDNMQNRRMNRGLEMQ